MDDDTAAMAQLRHPQHRRNQHNFTASICGFADKVLDHRGGARNLDGPAVTTLERAKRVLFDVDVCPKSDDRVRDPSMQRASCFSGAAMFIGESQLQTL